MSKNLHLTLVAVGGLAASPALADDATHAMLHVNPGLWEVVLTPQVSGEMPIPQSVLGKLLPSGKPSSRLRCKRL